MNTENITLCLTIGKRPEELRKTLESILSQLRFEHIIAINDFRDEETSQVFRELCPHGILIVQSEQVGHHRAVDLMYSQVKTPYVFHCEDDWFFDQPLQLDKYIDLLNNDPNANIVCLRKVSNFILTEEQQKKVKYYETKPLSTARLDYTNAKWHGYTFNPHIARIETWKKTGGFCNFKKERDVSIFFRSQGKYNLFLKEGVCHHIGENSVSYPQNQSFINKLKSKLYGYPVA